MNTPAGFWPMSTWNPWKRRQSLKRRLLQSGQRRLADFCKIFSRRAGTTACLFLICFFSCTAADNLWQFDPELQKAHSLILDLQTEEAYTLLTHAPSRTNELNKL